MKFKTHITRFNDYLAVQGTKMFGTMWTTYLFFGFGFLPLIFPAYMDKLLYCSNTVQLWSLPLILVGQNIMNRMSERRMEKMYQMMREMQVSIHDDLEIAKELIRQQNPDYVIPEFVKGNKKR
jgi:hypothetical protein